MSDDWGGRCVSPDLRANPLQMVCEAEAKVVVVVVVGRSIPPWRRAGPPPPPPTPRAAPPARGAPGGQRGERGGGGPCELPAETKWPPSAHSHHDPSQRSRTTPLRYKLRRMLRQYICFSIHAENMPRRAATARALQSCARGRAGGRVGYCHALSTRRLGHSRDAANHRRDPGDTHLGSIVVERGGGSVHSLSLKLSVSLSLSLVCLSRHSLVLSPLSLSLSRISLL